MSAFSSRTLRLRGALALCAALLVRCSPEIGQCIALPGSSVYVLPSGAEATAEGIVALALRGRAALLSVQVNLADARR
jgi:hypothetical protein